MDPILSVNHYICDAATPFPKFAEMVAAAGIAQVGVTRAALTEMGVPALARCLKDNGLGVSALCSAGYLTGNHPQSRADYTDDEMIDIAAEIGAVTLTTISAGAGDPSRPFAEAYAKVEAGLADLAARAAKKGVVLGLEPIHPNGILGRGCINTIAHAARLVAPHANVKLLLDVNHSWWDPDFPAIMTEAPESVVNIQICNMIFAADGTVGRDTLAAGDLDMTRMIRALMAGGFRGPFEFELFPGDLRGRDVRTLIEGYAAEFAACVAVA